MNKDEEMSYDEKRTISNLLKKYHAVFYQFWKFARVEFSNKNNNTLYIILSKKNDSLDLYINREFWESSSDEQKCFFICHECYHILNYHGSRTDGKCDSIKNIALDIPINEGLVKYFGFNRANIDPESKYCWIDNISKDIGIDLLSNQSFEYYYDLLKRNNVKINGNLLFNNHDYINNSTSQDEILKDEILDNLDENAKKTLNQIFKSAGINTNSLIKNLEKEKIKKKDKWETVIKNWSLKFIDLEFEVNSWLIKNRRLSILNLSDNLLLSNDVVLEDNKADKDKINVVFILDTSSSCEEYAERFWKATLSLDRKRFRIYCYCFDTKIYKIDFKKSQLNGFGGTSFKCLEKIQEEVEKEILRKRKHSFNKKNLYYFVITDGFGTSFRVNYPKKWIFFLTEFGVSHHINQKEIKIYNLADFE